MNEIRLVAGFFIKKMTKIEALDIIFNYIPPSVLNQLKDEGAYNDILSGKIKTGAEVYDNLNTEHAYLQDADYTELVSTLKPYFNSGSVLQIGCGRGDFLMRCAECGYNPIFGIDRSSVMLSEAIHRLRDNNNAKLYLEKVEDFNFSNLNSIDNVIMNNFWGMIDEVTSMNLLENLKKCLDTNGVVIIGAYFDSSKSKERYEAEKVLKDELGFVFSYNFFKDFGRCGYKSSTINTKGGKYFVLKLI